MAWPISLGLPQRARAPSLPEGLMSPLPCLRKGQVQEVPSAQLALVRVPSTREGSRAEGLTAGGSAAADLSLGPRLRP